MKLDNAPVIPETVISVVDVVVPLVQPVGDEVVIHELPVDVSMLVQPVGNEIVIQELPVDEDMSVYMWREFLLQSLPTSIECEPKKWTKKDRKADFNHLIHGKEEGILNMW